MPLRFDAFRAVLARHDSATAALAEWWSASAIRALPIPGNAEPATPDIRALLGCSADEPVGYRHVRLFCGDHVLSEARNWYVPGRLTADMNRLLAETDTPFGEVVAPLGVQRIRLDEVLGCAAQCPAGTILSHRAVLRRADGAAISLVVECYTPANLEA